MSCTKALAVILLSSLVCGEPPLQYIQPPYKHGINSLGSNNLAPNNDYSLQNTYLPPHNGFSGSDYNGHGQGHNYNHGQNNGYGQNHGHDHDHSYDHENEVPKSYEFGYSVKDAKSGNDYDRREMSDGNVVRGEYRVQLPDGRTQIVSYHADWRTGFHAEVRYEGEAQYPQNNNNGYNYNPPDYTGSSSGFHSGLQPPRPSYGSPFQ
ncbi:unnamed protein product [Leptidea sinapis]|uniref:Uncharacterized protein n=1 Tax=Leptidea sinapis TaxID=189913 RepID=A0A5E4QSJ8_9NEOP|nr:unnamed protein product [Leptidea sinapis]